MVIKSLSLTTLKSLTPTSLIRTFRVKFSGISRKRRKVLAIGLIIITLLTPLVYLTLLAPKAAEAAWYNDSWEFRKKLTIDYTKVSGGADLTNFPVLVSLTDLNLTKAQSGGNDILFTSSDGSTKLDHEIEKFTQSNGELVAWVRIPTLSASANTIIYIYYGNSSVTSQQNATGTWDANYKAVWHLKETGSPPATWADSTSNARTLTTVNNPIAQASGKIAGSLETDTTDNDAAQASDQVDFDVAPFTISAWIRPTELPSTSGHNGYYIQKRHSGSPWESWMIYSDSAGGIQNYFQMIVRDNTGTWLGTPANAAMSINTWYHVAGTIDSSKVVRFYINGTQQTATSTSTTTPAVFPSDNVFRIGDTGSVGAAAYYDEVRFSNMQRPAGWITTEYNNQSSPASFFSSGTEERNRQPVLNFNFDEGYGTTAADSSPGNNTGTLAGSTKPTWQTEDLCLSGKCLYFNGSTASVTVANTVNNVQSVSFWVRPKTNGETLLDLDGGTHSLSASGGTISATGFSSPTIYVNGTPSTTLGANSWQHIVVTTATKFNASSIKIGNVSTAYLNGFVDEFKIYDYARSAAQVKTDYVGRSSVSGSSASFGVRDYSYLSEGLVGYWKMDETSGNASDSSGNATTLTNNSVTAFTGAKFGNGAELDGSTDFFDAADNATLSQTGSITLSSWIIPDVITGDHAIVGKFDGANESYLLLQTADEIRLYIDSSSNYETTNAANLAANSTYHVAGVYDSVTASVKLYVNGVLQASTTTGTIPSSIGDDAGEFSIGAEDTGGTASNYFDGHLDDVRVYNRRFSPSEVAQLFLYGPGPVGYWNLDEASWNGTSGEVKDSSGYGNNGTAEGSGSTASVTLGKFGNAGNFIRANSHRINIGNQSYFQITGAMTLSAWIKLDSNNVWADVIGKEGNNGNYAYQLLAENDGSIDFNVSSNGSTLFGADSTTILSTGVWYHVAGVYTPSTSVAIYVNGVREAINTTSIPSSVFNSTNVLMLGSEIAGGINNINGTIDEAKVYNYPRTQAQIIEDMNAGHPAPGSPVGSPVIYWKFDEQQGTTANNSGTDASLDGTATGTVWRLENSTSGGCKINGCQNVDTASDSISAGDTAFTDSLTAMTTSFWLNPQTLTVDDTIVSKTNLSTQNSFLIRTDSTNSDEVRVYIASSLTDSANYYTTNNLDLTAAATYANWQHISVVYDGTLSAADRVKVYKDAVLKGGSVTGTIPTSMTSGSTSVLRAGDSDITGSEALLSYLDELKIYNFALTSDQVKVDATAGSSAAFGGVLGTHDNEGFGGNPPVGWWKMDENTGTTTYDSSGNGNTSGPFGGNATWTIGKYGSGLSFDGTDDVVRFGETTSTDLGGTSDNYTISAWFKTTIDSSTHAAIIAKRGTDNFPWFLYLNGTTERGCFDMLQAPNSVTICGTTALNDGNWHHIASVRNVTADTAYLYIDGIQVNSATDPTTATMANNYDVSIGNGSSDGSYSTYDFNGQIDEVRIYNYALSQAQVAYVFNRGGPIGYWKLDECSGSTANDSGFGANNGTITIGATGSNTSNGTCGGTAAQGWFDGKTGKRNASLEFDGTDDRVDMGNPTDLQLERTNAMTLEAWFKTTTDGGMTIAAKQQSVAPFAGYNLQTGAGGNLFFQLVNTYCTNCIEVTNTTDVTYNDGNWHHVAATYDGSSTAAGVKLYYDGASLPLATSDSLSASISNSVNFYVGSRNNAAQFFNGQIDEVKIYNYALTADQVKKSMNYGAQFFGPATGSP